MIELKMTFATAHEAAAFLTAAGFGAPAASVIGAGQPAPAPKPEKAAKTAKAADTPAEKPADKPKEEPKVTYETSGIGEKITIAQGKNKDATVALLKQFNARNEEGKLKGSALKPEQFADFIVAVDKIIAGEDEIEG